mgnify:CR=1
MIVSFKSLMKMSKYLYLITIIFFAFLIKLFFAYNYPVI